MAAEKQAAAQQTFVFQGHDGDKIISSEAALDVRSTAGFWSWKESDVQSTAGFWSVYAHSVKKMQRSHTLKKDKPYDRSVFQSLTMITQFGINMIVPIAMMTALGIFLDRKLETGYLTIVFFVLGAVAGGQNVYRMAKKIFSEQDKCSVTEKRKEDSSR